MHLTEEQLFEYACSMIQSGLVYTGTDPFELTDTLMKIVEEKEIKDRYTDSLIDFDDEIVSIEEMGELETIDISTTGDNLFYCNGLLTKNSIGGPMTADLFLALVQPQDLIEFNQMMVIQLKNRYNDKNRPERFLIGVDKSRMRFYDLEMSAQKDLMNGPIADEANDIKIKFNGFT